MRPAGPLALRSTLKGNNMTNPVLGTPLGTPATGAPSIAIVAVASSAATINQGDGP
jgi:hypothetical protein